MKKILLLFTFHISLSDYYQIGISTVKPDTSAILDITSTNKGVLCFDLVGYEFWNGSEWKKIIDSNIIEPKLTVLQCGSARLVPTNYTQNVPYTGTLVVLYVGGNGAYYSGGTKLGPINGLYYTLQSGTLAIPNRELYYKEEGTPTVSSPKPTVFTIDFLGLSCKARAGTNNVIKSIQYAKRYVSPLNSATTPLLSETPLEDITVRYNYKGSGGGYIEFKVNQSTHVSVMYEKAGAQLVDIEMYSQIIAVLGTWYKFSHTQIIKLSEHVSTETGTNFNSANRDLGVAFIVLHNTYKIYRVMLNTNGDIAANKNGVHGAPSVVTVFFRRT